MDFAKLKTLVTEQCPAIDTAIGELLRKYETVDKPLSGLFVRRDIESSRCVGLFRSAGAGRAYHR